MNPGSLNKRLKIVDYIKERNATGGFNEKPTEKVIVTCWGNVKPLSGKRYWEAQSEKAKVTHQVTVRYNPLINREQTVKLGKRTLTINHVINVDERDVEMILHCFEEM
ncbi:MAG: phage head closure protein [Clostridium sp.]|uniref:phage head closure protein n=1 Tax=Clostridium sp. TaxID=1506 RepID=UPI003F2D1A0D